MVAVSKGPAGQVYVTADGGDTWELRSDGLPADPAIALLAAPATSADVNRFVVVYRNAGVWETVDRGVNWWNRPSPPASSVVVDATWDPVRDRVWAATAEDGVWITGYGFAPNGLPTRSLTAIDYLPQSDTVLLGTSYAGVYRLTTSHITRDEVPVREVTASSVLRVHPAPFRSHLTVEVDLPDEAARSSIDVFDVAGRRVATLLPDGVRTGSRILSWNGRTADGGAAAPGVYFVSAKVGGVRRTQRVVRIR
jgi:hypothetical protein